MLTNDEILRAFTDAQAGHTVQSHLLAIGRAIEAKVLEKQHQPYTEGKTCRTCWHLDSDARHEPCSGCRDFARWAAPESSVKPL